MTMDAKKIQAALKTFIKKHKVEFNNLTVRETALLEIGAITMASEHYRIAGYTVTAENTKNGLFLTKLSTRGYPYNFSWFKCTKGDQIYEIHCNLPVEGGHGDNAVYVVDVAVVDGVSAVPKAKPPSPWKRLDNQSLATFAEVKKLVIYPMLLAQFVGIVHEIKPEYLDATKKAAPTDHFEPALVSLGYLQGTSSNVVKGFSSRGYRIGVVHSFDSHLAAIKKGSASASPFTAINGHI